ncbi:MAG TPA: PAS domain S-box protein [Acidimicrobiia bacterium]|nr:PAS domain S-box protein [Acidimicrobiia bacterium]
MSPATIAGGYGVISLAWIIGSDLLLASLGLGALDVNASLAKGVGFVLITGVLLFFVLRRRAQWLTAAGNELTRWVGEARGVESGHIRVLLIDDDLHERERIRQAITATVGFSTEVDEAANHVDGANAILERRHDVILIDDRIGLASGLDLIRQLHRVASGPMILITETDDPELDRKAQRLGAHDYLLKHEIHASWIGRTLRYAVANWYDQREVARTRQWYAEMVHEVPVGLFRTTPDGLLTEANPALLDIFGATSIDDLRAAGIRSLYRDPKVRRTLVERITAGEVVEDEDLAMQRLDGTPIDVRMRMRGISDPDGVIALYGAIMDVTAQLDTGRRIRTQASMLDQVKNAVVHTDTEGYVTYWNRAAETLFGWTAPEAIGRPVMELTPAPSEIERGNAIMRTMSETGSWEGEYLCRRKEGVEFPAYVSNSVVTGPNGETAGYVGITVDLTELKAAQRRAAAQEAMAASVLETVHFPSAVLDDDGTIIAVNGAWTDAAVDSEADLDAVGVGVSYLSVCDRSSDEDGWLVAAGIRSVLIGTESRFDHEYACAEKWFRVEVAPGVKPLGGAVAMHIDITELREATRQAEEFARSKDRLIASVSHELRTPLTAVLGFANLIEQPAGLSAEELAQFAAEIHRQATDMAAIVEDLLVAARAEMGALTVQLSAVDPIRQIRDVIGHLPHSATVSVEHHLTDVPAVMADPLRLRQILRNLVNNAIRYGGERVRVDTVTTPERIAIRISDDGQGVSPELAEAIFAPFFSAHDRSGQPDSLGLGLSVVRTLTEAMGGVVGLSTEEGWTVFTVSLPRADISE